MLPGGADVGELKPGEEIGEVLWEPAPVAYEDGDVSRGLSFEIEFR